MKKTLLFLSFILLEIPFLPAQADTSILSDAEQMPYFSGCTDYEDGSLEKRQCSARQLIDFISEHLVYPDRARDEQIEGTVIISFVVDEEGRVRDPYILRDIGGGCGEAAMDVVNYMPAWEPAVHKGLQTGVKLNLPIQFYLKDESDRLSAGYSISWGRLTGSSATAAAIRNNLDARVLVRDQFGDDVSINELIFSYARKKRYFEARSSGSITRAMEKLTRKVKRGGIFTITAAIQKEGKFVYVDKLIEVVE